jgi:hypothetical protein
MGNAVTLTSKANMPLSRSLKTADYFREGLAWVKSADGKIGYIGKDGNYVIAAEYAHGTPFSEGLAFVMSTDGSAPVCIDTKGNAKFTLEQAQGVGPFYKGYAQLGYYHRSYEDVRCEPVGYVDKSGKIISVPKVDKWQQFYDDYVERFGEGLYPFCDDNKKYGYRNKKGETVINPQFDGAGMFSEGLASVYVGDTNWRTGKLGFIDKKGEMVINPQFDDAGMFSEGLALVYVGDKNWRTGKWGVIDQTGKFVISPQFKSDDDIVRFNEKLYMFLDYKTNKYGLIDRQGNIVLTPQISKIAIEENEFEEERPVFHEGLIAFAVEKYDNYEWGVLDEKGNIVIKPQFDGVEIINDKLIAVRVRDEWNGKWGVIDRTGNFVINPQFDDINPNYRGGVAGFHIPNDFGYVGEMESVYYSMFSRHGHYY